MPKEPELKARDKVVMKMTRDGAVEENLTEGTSKSISGRLKDAELVKPIEEPELSGGLSAEEQTAKAAFFRATQQHFPYRCGNCRNGCHPQAQENGGSSKCRCR